MKKIRIYLGLINLQTKWLNKMSDKGYRLNGTGKLWYSFETCEPSEYRYTIDYVGDKSKAEAKEYAYFLEDLGYRAYFKNINLNLDLDDLVWEKLADKGDFFADRATALDRALLIVEKKNDGKPIKVVANLPYYITTPIIMGLLEGKAPIESITIMVQKEVAERMQTGPGSKDYGALSLAVQYYADANILMTVPASCFMPRPKVDSSVIKLDIYDKPPVDVCDEEMMFKIIRASFNQRRKTLVNGLKNASNLPFTKEEIEESIEKLGEDVRVRGEKLTLEQFAKLTNILMGEE